MSDSNTPFEPATGPDFGGPFKTVCDHFEEHMKSVNIDWEKKTLRFQVYGDHANMDVRIRVCEEDHVLQFFITLPVRVSNEKMRPVVAEYLARAQYGLVVGCLETDMRDGEVRYHITHLMEDHAVGDMIVGRLFRTGMSTFDRSFPDFCRSFTGATLRRTPSTWRNLISTPKASVTNPPHRQLQKRGSRPRVPGREAVKIPVARERGAIPSRPRPSLRMRMSFRIFAPVVEWQTR